MPKSIHRKVPVVNNIYMYRDMPEVSFVRMVLIACGKKEAVVQKAPAKPMIVIQSILLVYVMIKMCAIKKELSDCTLLSFF
jgi:hypothetical protein